MGRKSNKFMQISNIYSQFTEENRKNLIKTAKSLLEVQRDSEAMLVIPPLNGMVEANTVKGRQK